MNCVEAQSVAGTCVASQTTSASCVAAQSATGTEVAVVTLGVSDVASVLFEMSSRFDDDWRIRLGDEVLTDPRVCVAVNSDARSFLYEGPCETGDEFLIDCFDGWQFTWHAYPVQVTVTRTDASVEVYNVGADVTGTSTGTGTNYFGPPDFISYHAEVSFIIPPKP